MISFKEAHFPQDIILMGVRWYVAYPLSYRHGEELMEAALHRCKPPVWVSWRRDATYIQGKGQGS